MGSAKIYTLIGAYLLTAAILLLFNRSSVFKPVEETLLDIKFRTFERDIPEQDVALIMIDEYSLNELSGKMEIYWPWPREIYSYMHNYLSSKGARLIVYDIILDQPDFNRPGFNGRQSDHRFEISMGTYGNAVLVMYTNPAESPAGNSGFSSAYEVEGFGEEQYYSISNLPLQSFQETARTIGSVTMVTENETLIRKVPLLFSLGENKYAASVALSSFMAQPELQEAPLISEKNKLIAGGEEIPLTQDGQYLVNWYGRGGGGTEEGSFDNYSFVSILRNAIQFAQTGEAPIDSLIDVEGKIVMIGANAAGLSDIKSTPMSPLEPFPGVEIHATVLQNMLASDYITVVSAENIWYIIVMLTVILLLYYVIFYHSYSINIPVAMFLLVATGLAGFLVFSWYRIWVPTAESSIYLTFALVVGFVTKYVTEDIEKRKIRSAFGMYVQKELVDKISRNPEILRLGGQKKELSIIFSDLAGFTSISEAYDPEQLVTFLNEYLTEMTNIVFEQKGTLDKYIGDAIMAFWGAPLEDELHAYHACKCVLEMQKSLKKLQKKWKEEGKPHPEVRFGINTGEVVVGNMGSQERFNYTVLGDHVNLAARLEPANKDFGTYVLMSEFTKNKAGDAFLSREVAMLKVKGREVPVRIFELLDERTAESEEYYLPLIEKFEHALKLYYEYRLDEAASAFLDFIREYGEDELSETYLKRIGHYQAFPPDGKWQGIHEQVTK